MNRIDEPRSPLPPGAYISEEGWVVYGEQAYLPEEWAVHAPTRPNWPEMRTELVVEERPVYLTQRERQIVELLADGKAWTLRDAASQLGTALQTVKNQLHTARIRTGCPTTAALVAKVSRGEL